ncbi:acyltransferase family protein [Paenibacillus faecalis]|uniref:acyltransferase family protein n=1 Tax=Paenibacillus faecalis TaxID=2079532 RepID=UPI000D0FE23E|nr:acyltransferase family protein [Paenibacillus faecalis]
MSKKIFYLDNIKVFLAFLVIFFHTNSSYGGEGGWYYIEASNDEISKSILTFINALFQSFFMGLFFFISAYFTPRSYDNKGFHSFLKGKVMKLLIPALFYFFVLNPLCISLVNPQPYLSSLGFYNTWFIVALLYFYIIYALVRKWTGGHTLTASFPNKGGVLVYILVIGVLNFLTRLVFSTNELYIHDFSLGYFPQYIVLFWLGTVAYRNGWLEHINSQIVSFYFRVSLVSLLTLPIVFLISDLYADDFSAFYGGMTWESLYYSFWEPFTGVGIMMKIVYVFKSKLNFTTSWLGKLSRSSYAIYIIHAPVIVSLQLALKTIPVHLMIKVAIVTVFTLIFSFFISYCLLKNRMISQII